MAKPKVANLPLFLIIYMYFDTDMICLNWPIIKSHTAKIYDMTKFEELQDLIPDTNSTFLS